MIDNIKKELIALEVIRTLFSRFESFPEDVAENRNAPFHEAFLNAFSQKLHGLVASIPIFISLSSWMHGLHTTLGQSFFENVAHILSDGEKRAFKNLRISQNLQTIISDIITNLKNANSSPNLLLENSKIFTEDDSPKKEIPNFTADVFFEDEHQVVAIELKTVKPNSGIFKIEKEKILTGKAALKSLYQNKKILYYLGFPFDPLSKNPTGSNKIKYMGYSVDCKKYIDPEEILLADELWDFLSGSKNTMELILEIINAVATPSFMENYCFLNNKENIKNEIGKIIGLFDKWYMYREKEIVQNIDILVNKARNSKPLQRTLNQSIFKTDGKYNIKRMERLIYLL